MDENQKPVLNPTPPVGGPPNPPPLAPTDSPDIPPPPAPEPPAPTTPTPPTEEKSESDAPTGGDGAEVSTEDIEESNLPPVFTPPPKPNKTKLIASIAAILLLLVSIPAGIFLVQRSQEVREQAAELCTYGQTCGSGGRQACTGTVQGGTCKHDPSVPPNCSPCTTCGDGTCGPGEGPDNCPQDCKGGAPAPAPVTSPTGEKTTYEKCLEAGCEGDGDQVKPGTQFLCHNDSKSEKGGIQGCYLECDAGKEWAPDHSKCVPVGSGGDTGVEQSLIDQYIAQGYTDHVYFDCTQCDENQKCQTPNIGLNPTFHAGKASDAPCRQRDICNPKTNDCKLVDLCDKDCSGPVAQQQPQQPAGGPQPFAQCLNIKAYDTSWNQLPVADLSKLKAGDKVRFAVSGSSSSGNFDRARFKINSGSFQETTSKKPGSNEFYLEYTLVEGVTTFNITGQLHHPEFNQWF